MAKFYAVKIGRKPGIYLTWDECKQQVDKFKGAVYKSFNSKDEAKVFLEEKKIKFDSGLIPVFRREHHESLVPNLILKPPTP